MLWQVNWYGIAADLLVIVHFMFVVFVIFGGLLLLWRRVLVWVHLPALLWGIGIEAGGWLCPLTGWENNLRQLAEQGGYSGDFVMHYIMPILYPAELTRHIQIAFAVALLVFNAGVYYWVFAARPRRR